MFFRNAKPKVWTFDERLSDLTQAGFTVSRDSGQTIARRGAFAASLEDKGSGQVEIGKVGVLIGREIGVLTSGGYQMFLRTPSGKELPHRQRISRACMRSTRICARRSVSPASTTSRSARRVKRTCIIASPIAIINTTNPGKSSPRS